MIVHCFFICLFGQIWPSHSTVDVLKCPNQGLVQKDIWQKQYQKGMLGPVGDPIVKHITCGLSRHQLFLDALDGHGYLANADHHSSANFRIFKRRLNEINQKDPELGRVLDGLIATEIEAKRTITNGHIPLINPLKIRLTDAILFMAKRQNISLNQQKLNQKVNNEQIFSELDKLLFRNNGKGNEWTHKRKCNYDQYKSDQRILQLIMGKINEDGQLTLSADGHSRRQRRRKRQPRNVDDVSAWNIAEPFIVFTCVLLFVLFFMLANGCFRTMARQNGGGTSGDGNGTQMGTKYANAFAALPSTTFWAQNDDEMRECSICLGAIGPGTVVKPLPACQHIFHNACIVPWLYAEKNGCPLCRTNIFTLNSDGQVVPNVKKSDKKQKVAEIVENQQTNNDHQSNTVEESSNTHSNGQIEMNSGNIDRTESIDNAQRQPIDRPIDTDQLHKSNLQKEHAEGSNGQSSDGGQSDSYALNQAEQMV